MSSSAPNERSGTKSRQRLMCHLAAALEEAENENLRFHIRQALQFAQKTDGD